MRIRSIEFNDEVTKEIGLSKIKMEKLGSVVALIGKNGSGKSRILDLVAKEYSPSIDDFIDQKLVRIPKVIQDSVNQLEPYKRYLKKREEVDNLNLLRKKEPNNNHLVDEMRRLKNEISELEKKLPNIIPKSAKGSNMAMPASQVLMTVNSRVKAITEKANANIERFKQDYIKRVDYNQIRQLREAVSDKEENMNSFEALVEGVTGNLDYDEFGSVYASSIKYLKKLSHQLAFDWLECFGDKKKFQSRTAYARFTALKEIFDNLMGKSLEWETITSNRRLTDSGVQSTIVGVWKINGREFNYSEFSDGEKTLFAYVLLFFLMSQNRSIRLRESIIVIDEPELHLHPDAEIDLINGIRSIIEENGQLWIATHSINILSHLHYDEVFVVRDGAISHPAKTTQRIALLELIKIEEKWNKLSEFINSINDWTYVQYMIECFTNPDVIEVASQNDPQIKSLEQLIRLGGESKSRVLLDFGAGKGRLYDLVVNNSQFDELINYTAYEPNTEHHEALKARGVKSVLASLDEIKEDRFDYVVLCNVLHEIDIDEWISCLNKVVDSINPDGSLIVIEAKMLTKGERIGAIGHLLLGEPELKLLFNLDDETLIKNKEDYESITSVLMPRSKIRGVSMRSVISAIEALKNRCFSEIEKLRVEGLENEVNSNKYGRRSTFLSQQYINAILALQHLKKGRIS